MVRAGPKDGEGGFFPMHKIATDAAPQAVGPYSQGMRVGQLVFTSGQIPLDPVTGLMLAGGIEAQAEQSCRNVRVVLEAAGSSLERVVKTTCFLSDMADFQKFNQVYERHFVSCPARSCVAVKTLPRDALCEIEAIALAGEE
jgi:2-iminobutanoate/2-iminopropanoate deaminase